MKRFKECIIDFITDESGTAIIEWVIVLCIAAGLAGVVMVVGGTARDKVNDVGNSIANIDTKWGD